MNTVKKSIFRIATAAFASAVMVVTSVAPALAMNDYRTQTGGTWTHVNSNGHVTTEENGVVTSTRTRFNVNGGVEVVDGKWATNATTGATGPQIAIDGGVTSGMMQFKYTLTFVEGDRSMCKMDIRKSQNDNQLGLRITRYGEIKFVNAGGGFVGGGNMSVETGVPYNVTLTVNVAAQTIYAKIVNANTSAVCYDGSFVYNDDQWGNGFNYPVSAIDFTSPRGEDLPTLANNMTVGTAVSEDIPTKSVWTISNVSYDAFSEVDYDISEMYRNDTHGLVTNQKADGYTTMGVAIEKLTNMTGASLFSAAYDTDNRMVDLQVDSTSAAGVKSIAAATGDTVKYFAMDMDTARPVSKAYTPGTSPSNVIKKLDFESGLTTEAIAETNGANLVYANGYTITGGSNHATYGKSVDMQIVDESGNKVFKLVRKLTGNGTTVYQWDGEKWNTYGDANNKISNPADVAGIIMPCDSTTNLKASFEFKFDETSDKREIFIGLNGDKYGVPIDRNGDGTWKLGESGQTGKLIAGNWYTIEVEWTDFVQDGEDDNSKPKYKATYKATVKGDFGSGVTSVKRESTAGAKTTNPSACTSVELRSRRNMSGEDGGDVNKTAAPAAWYIDDFTIEYTK